MCIGANARTSSYYGDRKPFHFIDLNCNGTEDNIFECSYNTITKHSCAYYEDAVVECQGIVIYDQLLLCYNTFFAAPNATVENCTNGQIRLAGGKSEYEGRVEICYAGSWRTVCPSSWDNNEANVVCRQLCFTMIG